MAENSDKTTLKNKLALAILRKYKLSQKKIFVPPNFPLAMADYLRSKGIKLAVENLFFPERAIKSPEEIKTITAIMKKVSQAFKCLEKILREAKIKGKYIYWQKQKLTAELLKIKISNLLIDLDLIDVDGTILSTGKQTAAPHHSGSGAILANQPIVFDLFPREKNSGYFGDMTRTYVKGTPSPKIVKMYHVVKKAQEAALKMARPGVSGLEIHRLVEKIFLAEGFDVGNKGFIHGTGHGLGVDLHEAPSANKYSYDILQPGNIITIEPGLYYPGVGGVRIEDVILITGQGNENLTNYPKILLIK